MQESGTWCATRLSSRATFISVIYKDHRNVQGAKMILFADDTNLLIN
jgi:hypothetical protein